MSEVGIRALKQNAAAVVAAAEAGEVVTVTRRGAPVAQLSPLPTSRVRALVDAGLARAAKRTIASLGEPVEATPLSPALERMRDEERY